MDSLLVTANTCIPYIGNIVLCYEEGTELLPGPVNDLQAEVVDDTSVYLEWEPPVDQNNITSYEVHYQKTDNTSMHKTPLKLDHVSLRLCRRRLTCYTVISNFSKL